MMPFPPLPLVHAHARRAQSSTLERAAQAFRYREAGEMFDVRAQTTDSLCIGVTSSLSHGLLRGLVKGLNTAPGAPLISIVEGSGDQVVRGVRRGEIDAGFVCDLRDRTGVSAEALWREPVHAAMSEHHPLARKQTIAPESLRRETFVISGPHSELDRQLALIDRTITGRPAGVLRLDVGRENLMNLVGLGFGVALQPSSGLAVNYPRVVHRPIDSEGANVAFHLVWRETGRGGRRIDALLATVRALASRWVEDANGGHWRGLQ